MTDKLQTLMREQADSVDFAAPDLDAMIRTGDRRRRTRSAAAVVGVAAASVLGVAGVQAVVPEPTTRVHPTSPTAPGETPLSWVMGSVLHEGDRTTELSFRPVAYVATGAGYVLSDRDGTVWSLVDGSAAEAGRTAARDPHLVADPESGLAGWHDPTTGSYVVLHQAEGTYDVAPGHEGAAPQDFVALDDGKAYYRTGRGLATFDPATGSTVLPVDGTVADVEDGLLAVRSEDGVTLQTVDGRVLDRLGDFHGELGAFSDDARFFTNDADEPQVYDLARGEQVRLDVGTREFATGYEWLDGHRLAVIAAAEASQDSVAELLSCEVPSGSCTPLTELGPFTGLADTLVLPTGTPTDG